LGEIRLCISGKMTEEKLEEGDNSRTRYLEMMEKWVETKKRYRMERSFSRYYWSVARGLGNPWVS